MNEFSEYLQTIEKSFRESGFSGVNIAPPGTLIISNSQLEMTLDIRVHHAIPSQSGSLKGFLTLSGSKDTYRRLGLLLLVFAVITSTRSFEQKQKGGKDIGRPVISLNLLGKGADGEENGADKLIIGGDSYLTCFDFVPTSIRYFYEGSDASANSREWAPVSRYDRPCFEFYEDEKSLWLGWSGSVKLPLGQRSVSMGNTVSALLRLGGFLLDFSHPDANAEFLELEQVFEQVAPHSYDMNFVLTGSESEFLVFG